MDSNIRIKRTGIRILLFLAVMTLMIALSAVSAHAASPASLTNPNDGSTLQLGKKVTIKAKSSYDKPDEAGIITLNYPNYIYIRVSKDGNTLLYTSKTFNRLSAITGVSVDFTPTEATGGVGLYLIEVCKDYTYDGDTHVDLSEADFLKRVEDSRTIKVWKYINKDITAVEGLTDKVYTGSEQTQNVTVTVDGKTLIAGTDYNLVYSDNVNVGTAKMTVHPTGESFYREESGKPVTFDFQITPADITKASVSGLGAVDYNGSAQTPAPVLTWNGKTLTSGTDYDVTYASNTNVGTANVTITGKGNFTGTIGKTFTIRPASIRNATLTGLVDKNYSGSAQTQNLTLKMLGRTLVKDTDYTVAYQNNTDPGTATVTITGKGNFSDSIVRTFQIKEVQSSSGGYATILAPDNGATFSVGSTIDVDLNGQYTTPTYNGTTLTGQPNSLWLKITRDGTTVIYGRIAYTSTSQIKTYHLNADIKGVYTIQLCRDIVWAPDPPGSTSLAPRVIEEKDFVPTAQIKIYVGVPGLSNISSATVTGISDKEYTGNSITLSPTVKLGSTTLKNGTDYYCLYSNNLEVGTATLTIKGKGNYTGTITKTFNITAKKITADMITLSPASFIYNGSLQKPGVTVNNGSVRLTEGTDYTLVNSGGTTPGQYEVTVTGKGNYTGTGTKTYSIGKIPINSAVVSVEGASRVVLYNGKEHRPSFGVKLNGTTLEPKVYTVTYSDNINAGTAKITVTAKDDSFYTGSAVGTFTIDKVMITSSHVKIGVIGDVVYNRKEQKPVPEITFDDDPITAGTDFTLAYANNINKGRAEVTITGKGNFTGSRQTYFNITAKDIADESVKVDEIPYQLYTEGTPATPAVTVRDGSDVLTGAEFDVAYADNDKVGKAAVTITGKGNYKGTRSAEFDILDKMDFDVAALEDKIAEIESKLDSYLAPDKTALQNAIDAATALIGSEDKTSEQLEAALADLTALEAKADKNLADAQAEANKPKPTPQNPAKGADGTAFGKGVSVEAAEAAILALPNDNDPAGTTFGMLQLKATKTTKSSIKLTWKAVPGANRYILFANKCGAGNRYKKLGVVTGTSFTATQAAGAAIRKGTYYKFIMIAAGANGKVLSTSKTVHVATKGGKVGNHKSINVSKSMIKKAKKLKKGKTIKLKAKAVPQVKKLKVKKHRGIQYETSNAAVAQVNGKGTVNAVGKGTCYIYAYAQNGVCKKITVKVK